MTEANFRPFGHTARGGHASSARPPRRRHGCGLFRRWWPGGPSEDEVDGSGALGEPGADGDPEDVAEGDPLSDGEDDGDDEGDALLDGDDEGLDVGECEVALELGGAGGLTAAPISVSRSNFEAF